MELIQLFYFKEVAKYENMTLAAKRNHISQQALSKSVRKLEEELGTRLFERNNNRLSLNASGRRALEQIDAIFLHVENLKNTVQSTSFSREFVIGSSSLASIRSLILDFNNAYPNFFISAKSLPEDQLIERLNQCQIDLAVSSQQYPPFYSRHMFCSDLAGDPYAGCSHKPSSLQKRFRLYTGSGRAENSSPENV